MKHKHCDVIVALLGKLRALERRLTDMGLIDLQPMQTLEDYDDATREIIDLLPAIIAQIERDEKDVARLEFLAGRPMVVEFRQDGPGTVLGFVVPDIRVNNNARDNIDRAIDAAKDRT